MLLWLLALDLIDISALSPLSLVRVIRLEEPNRRTFTIEAQGSRTLVVL